MPRRDRSRSSAPTEAFPRLGPVDTVIPTSTGSVRLIRESDGSVLLEVNGVPSSQQHPDPAHLVFEYMRWMALLVGLHLEREEVREALAASPAPPEIAHLGGGGCSLPRALAATHPAARQLVVELDGQLAELVRTWFELPRSPRLRIRVDNAAEALAAWREDRFEVLIRDVFAGDRTPAELITLETAHQADRVLRPGGIYLANCAAPPGSGMIAAEIATLAEVFAHVGVIAEPAHLGNKRRGNAVLLASQEPLPEGVDRALRSDAVSVRLAPRDQVENLRRSGQVLRAGA